MSNVLGTVHGLPPNGLTGAASGDQFGTSAASAGDVDGDGIPDIIVGAPFNDAGGANAGRAYLYLGGASMDNDPAVTLTGLVPSDAFGFAVSSAGDVNGDGYGDVIVGAYGNDAGGGNAGQAYVFLGGPSMDAVADVALTGEAAGDNFGYSVSGAGDVNGDGYGDVLVGAMGHDTGGANRGRAYVFYGGASMNAAPDVILKGTAAGDQFGLAVSGAGDLDGDGYADVVVGSPFNDVRGSNAGKATVYFGGASMNAVPDVTMTGTAAGDWLGYSVSDAGDVNGDGYADLIVGADAAGTKPGWATVYLGGASMDNAADVTLTGPGTGSYFGRAVSGAGDVDGDGFSDLLVGAPAQSAGGSSAGRVYVYLGGASVSTAAEAILSGTAGENFGYAVAGLRDIDGDGRDEVALAAPSFNGVRGRVSVLGVDLTGEDLPDEFFTGAAPEDLFGSAVSSAGDVNGDGYDDVIVGAFANDAGGSNAGRAYIYLGGPAADATADVTLTGAAADDRFGYSVSGAGDVNGDGYDDVIVGAYLNDAGGANAGRAYVYFGGALMNGVADMTLTGAAADDRFGYSVSGAGDVNGDGYDDVIVGAYLNDGFGTNAGRTYVYFGGPVMDAIADVEMTTSAGSENYLGFSVSRAGDVNGDGYDDVVVGVPKSLSGMAFIYFGGAPMNNGVDIVLTGPENSYEFGSVVSGAGDVNGDSYADVIVGDPNNGEGGPTAGRAYVYFGGSPMNTVADVTMTGARGNDVLGGSVSGAGDVNGDGYDDVVVAAAGNDASGTNAGQATVYFGGTAMDSESDVTLSGAAGFDSFGSAVSGVGDVNGDGLDDLIIGAPGNDAGGTDAGRAYLYLSTFPAAAPHISAVRDVPDDQGGSVIVRWARSAYDGEGDARVTGYLVQRSESGGAPAWEPVATIPATRETLYSTVVPTYGVPAEGTSTPVRVRVTAVTAQASQFWRSTVVTGASIDNIPPPAPLSLTAAPDGAGVRLTWSAPQAPDLASYAVYRSASPGVTDDSTHLVAVVDGLNWVDASGGGFYRVAARDANGNEGAPSDEASVLATDADGLPTDFVLGAPLPNPSLGATEIRFDVPTASRIRLTLYDLQGREVARLIDADRPAGVHRVSLGTARLAAGTYVIRMEAGDSSATRSLTIVR